MHTEQTSPADRRTEMRLPASGEVYLREPNAPGATFVGRVLDVASSGFRARHDHFTLGSGELVDFELSGQCGLARAMWTRIVDGQVETGFRICQLKDARPAA